MDSVDDGATGFLPLATAAIHPILLALHKLAQVLVIGEDYYMVIIANIGLNGRQASRVQTRADVVQLIHGTSFRCLTLTHP